MLVAEAGVPSTTMMVPSPPIFLKQIARDVAGERAVVGADKGDAAAGGGTGDDVEQRDGGCVELQDRAVHRGDVHRHEHDGVGLCRDRLADQRDLLFDVVGLLGNVVQGFAASRAAVRSAPSRAAS